MRFGVTIDDLPILIVYLIVAIFALIIIISIHDWYKYERKHGRSQYR